MRYKNSFHQQHNIYSREYYETDVCPIVYKGYSIYKRSDIEYHIVKDGVCIGMNAGLNGAKDKIDRGNFR